MPGGRPILAAAAVFLSLAGAARSVPPPIAGLDSLASATLLDGLRRLEVAPPELGFEKLYAEDDTFRLGIVEELLRDPLRLPQWQTDVVRTARRLAGEPGPLAASLGELGEATAGVSRMMVPPVDLPEFLALCRSAETDLALSFSALTLAEQTRLLVLAPSVWGDWENPDSPDRLRKGMLQFARSLPADTAFVVSEKPILDAAARVDRGALTAATLQFFTAVSGMAEVAQHLSSSSVSSMEGILGPITAAQETPWGLFVVGGPGRNVYEARALERIAFLVEPGGDDVYSGTIASALGGLTRPLSAIVDLAGDDLYDGRAPFALAGAVLGVAVLIDEGGDDVYRGEDGSLGAGFFGAGFLFDRGGTDLFEGRNFTQGAGAIGIGALVSWSGDLAPPGPPPEKDPAFDQGLIPVAGTGARPVRYDENDSYRCARQGQGFASTFGVGLLYDRAGNDGYRAGGEYLHAPLRPHDFQSLSQGFSIGFRPRAAGGIGILIDEEGNDFYDAEVYAQGVSYWYSIGLLFDGGGNDRYHATQYAQGAGVHLAVGSLWDRGGDDQYVAQFGVTQGTAHDLSAGMLRDEAGNDYYLVDGGQGVSLTNSVGIFLDEQGDDLYATIGGSQGTLNWARGFSGAALFADLEGKDRYARDAPGADGAIWMQDLFAVGIDLDRDIVLPGETVPEPVLTRADSLRSVEELFDTASLWEVGSARESVARARKALIAKGPAALGYVTRERLGTDDGLEYRAIESLARAYPDSASARLVPRLRDRDPKVLANVIRLLGDLKRVEARLPLVAMLSERRLEEQWVRVIEALGKIGDAKAAPALRPFLRDAQERRRIQTAVALAALRDTTATDRIAEQLDDPLLTVRAAASAALVGLGPPSAGAVLARLDRRAAHRPLGLRTLGRLAASLKDREDPASARARQQIAAALLAEITDLSRPAAGDPQSRAAAVEAILAFDLAEMTGVLRARMAAENDPLVRRTYEWGTRRSEP
jgi:HEAT repeat protein